jgi:hypothetical protein
MNKIIKLSFILVTLILFSFISDKAISVINVSLIDLTFPGFEPVSDLDINLTINILFKDDSFILDELKNSFIKIINDNQEIINIKYSTFKEKFINFLENNKKKYKFDKDLLYKDDDYLKKRFYIILYNTFNCGYFYKIYNYLQKSEYKDMMMEYFKSDSWQKFLIETTIEFKKIPEIQKFYESYKDLFSKKVQQMEIDKLINNYFLHYNIESHKDSIQIYFSEIYFFYGRDSIENLIGLSDINNYYLSKYSGFYVANSDFITLSIELLKAKNLFLHIFFHEMTHWVLNQADSGYYLSDFFPQNVMDYSQYNSYLSNYNNNEFFSLPEVEADLFSIEMMDYYNINFTENIEDTEIKRYYDYLNYLKYFNLLYKEYCKINKIENPYFIKSDIKNDKNSIYIANEDSIKSFMIYIYKNRIQFGRKIVKLMRNINLIDDY